MNGWRSVSSVCRIPSFTHSLSEHIYAMRVHAAFWVFALEVGTPHTKEHVRERAPEDDESKWLTWKDGTRIRKLWLALTPEDRAERMARTPDSTFPSDKTTGILDDRTKASTRVKTKPKKSSAVSSTVQLECGSSEGSHTTVSPQSTRPEPASVSRLLKSRSDYITAEQRRAIAAVQLGFKSSDDGQLIAGLCSFWENVGAEILLELPSKHRANIAAIVNTHIMQMKSARSGAYIEDLVDLQDRFLTFDESSTRFYRRYCDRSVDAIAECAELGLGDPDPPLPFGFLARRANHPTFPGADPPSVLTKDSTPVPASGSKPKKRAASRTDVVPSPKKGVSRSAAARILLKKGPVSQAKKPKRAAAIAAELKAKEDRRREQRALAEEARELRPSNMQQFDSDGEMLSDCDEISAMDADTQRQLEEAYERWRQPLPQPSSTQLG